MAETIIGHTTDFKIISKEIVVSIEKYSIQLEVIFGS